MDITPKQKIQDALTQFSTSGCWSHDRHMTSLCIASCHKWVLCRACIFSRSIHLYLRSTLSSRIGINRVAAVTPLTGVAEVKATEIGYPAGLSFLCEQIYRNFVPKRMDSYIFLENFRVNRTAVQKGRNPYIVREIRETWQGMN